MVLFFLSLLTFFFSLNNYYGSSVFFQIDKFIKSSDTQLKKKNIDRREVKDLHER